MDCCDLPLVQTCDQILAQVIIDCCENPMVISHLLEALLCWSCWIVLRIILGEKSTKS